MFYIVVLNFDPIEKEIDLSFGHPTLSEQQSQLLIIKPMCVHVLWLDNRKRRFLDLCSTGNIRSKTNTWPISNTEC